MGNVIRDMPLIAGGIEGGQQFFELNEVWFQALLEGWPSSADGAEGLGVAIRHALDYGTWLSLTSQGMSNDQARDAMVSFIGVMSGGEGVAVDGGSDSVRAPLRA
jgi:hypothetical protein